MTARVEQSFAGSQVPKTFAAILLVTEAARNRTGYHDLQDAKGKQGTKDIPEMR